jgi:amino acid transporter
MFIFTALVFDLYKWCLFIAFTNHSDAQVSERRELWLKRGLITLQIIIVFFSLLLITLVLVSNHLEDLPRRQTYLKVQNIFNALIFGIFLIFYCIILDILRKRLKDLYPQFFKTQRMQIYLANALIIVAILVRIIILIIYSVDEIWEQLVQSLMEGTWLYPLSQLGVIALANIFPIGTILYSLVQNFRLQQAQFDDLIRELYNE